MKPEYYFGDYPIAKKNFASVFRLAINCQVTSTIKDGMWPK